MSFQEWQKNGWLRPHQPTRDEVAGLLAVIDRDLSASADPNLDDDWKFAIASHRVDVPHPQSSAILRGLRGVLFSSPT